MSIGNLFSSVQNRIEAVSSGVSDVIDGGVDRVVQQSARISGNAGDATSEAISRSNFRFQGFRGRLPSLSLPNEFSSTGKEILRPLGNAVRQVGAQMARAGAEASAEVAVATAPVLAEASGVAGELAAEAAPIAGAAVGHLLRGVGSIVSTVAGNAQAQDLAREVGEQAVQYAANQAESRVRAKAEEVKGIAEDWLDGKCSTREALQGLGKATDKFSRDAENACNFFAHMANSGRSDDAPAASPERPSPAVARSSFKDAVRRVVIQQEGSTPITPSARSSESGSDASPAAGRPNFKNAMRRALARPPFTPVTPSVHSPDFVPDSSPSRKERAKAAMRATVNRLTPGCISLQGEDQAQLTQPA